MNEENKFDIDWAKCQQLTESVTVDKKWLEKTDLERFEYLLESIEQVAGGLTTTDKEQK